MRPAVFMAVVATLAIVGLPPASAEETIASDMTRNENVGQEQWDTFRVTMPSGKKAVVSFTGASGNLDFYVFTQAQYDDYSNPNVPSFDWTASRQKSRSFTYTTFQSGLLFVVDNAYISTSGATPNGPESYAMSVQFATSSFADTLQQNACLLLVAIGIALAVGTTTWYTAAPKPYRETSKQLRAVLR